MDEPTFDELMEESGYCLATDGCMVEPDGTCEHGCDSWMLVLGIREQQMRDFTQYVHEYENAIGETRYAVGEWFQERGQYICPHGAHTAKLTGCSGSFAQTAAGLPDTYESRGRALRRARYLFYEMDKEYQDFMSEE